MSQDTAAPAAPVTVEAAVVVEEGHKVFVGNLSFQTTKEELAEHFSKPTPALKADIITRNVRSLGYGFVAFETLAQAEEAVKRYNQSELSGRTINVEVAKPKVEHPPREPKPRNRSKKSKAAAAAAADGDSNDAANPEAAPTGTSSEGEKDASADEGRKKGRRSNRPRRKAKSKAEAKEGDESATNGEAAAAEGDRESAGKRRNRRKGPNAGAAAGGSNGVEATFTAAAPAEPRAPRPQGPPSKTTVFVANLPFSMKDEGLKELFKEFKVTSARVVRRQGSGRSKGYGFVELVDEAEQHRVLDKMKDVTTDGRELSIGIARSENPANAAEDGKDAAGAAAPANKSGDNWKEESNSDSNWV
ncbi:hypothetical protein DFQ27_001707 [Actinomortierella ambigua]|uniref:RRM domain-containing protein n=1 Tax=Actinomortierella ambigua TaxID=1343610 RepID=A0A9P6UD12_9FUNG|nr:hypothetical protein DFQ27_001707 [Actinomortierella ambigua]